MRAIVKNDNTLTTVTSASVLATATWYNVILSYGGEEVRLYINGQNDGSAAHIDVEITEQPMRFAGGMWSTVPAFASATTNTGNTNSPIGTKPASTGAGDLLIAHVGTHDGTLDDQVDYPTDGSGADFELVAAEQPNGTPSLGTWSQVRVKVATASEPASYTWESRVGGALDAMPWVVAVIRIAAGQFDATTPLAQPVYSAVSTASVTTINSGPHIPAVANALRIDFFGTRGAVTWTEDSGTERYDAASTNFGIAACTQTASFPTSLTVTGTATSQAKAAHTLFVNGVGIVETACSGRRLVVP